ncbi:HD-GYP domain-containing protein [Marinomonas sp. 15G1-11]|uniref:HD-GYP domain-containing protein n=1 Tax=Marinomonas phaeophyticola TaxID=3004091 RepID=A0ABT4JSK5_9GAMM|nr:HD-GYP domain-containing protein [Marinomonas sp. 15G1-11]MCZ2721230.1 HD-GYP domain-containing protein [Marinomonas sp. 15G1-11]
MGIFDRVGQLVRSQPATSKALAPESNQQMLEAHLSSLLASLLTMAWFVEARDPYTGGHLWRVSRFALLLAETSGLNKAQAAQISLGGFLHDLGKIGIPDAILGKTSRLTDDEYDVIKTHPEMGFRMLGGHPLADFVKDAVLLHHERPDGKGYPRGLLEDEIPLMAKIVGLCDAFDAMTSSRPYRSGMPIEKALSIIESNLGTQFDAKLGSLFIDLGRQKQLDLIVGYSDDGIPLEQCQACGLTLVIHKEHKAGDHLFCRQCTGEFVLDDVNGSLSPIATGRRGSASDLEPHLDQQLIANTVKQSIAAMPITDLTQAVMSNFKSS